MGEGCIFCRIVEGTVPAQVVHRTDRVLAFRDLNPQAPVHVLIIPTAHLSAIRTLEDHDRELAGELLLAARDVAVQEGLAERGYRIVANTGIDGGQTVDHLHLHLLGGRAMAWPPG